MTTAARETGHRRRHRDAQRRRRHATHSSRTRGVLEDEGGVCAEELCAFSDGSDAERVELERALSKSGDDSVVEEEELCAFSDGSDVERVELEQALAHEQSSVVEEEEELCAFSDGSDVERVELEQALRTREKKPRKREGRHRHCGTARRARKAQSETAAAAEAPPEAPREEEHDGTATAPPPPPAAAAARPVEAPPLTADTGRTSVSSIRRMFEQMSAASQRAAGPARARRPPNTGLRTSLHVYRRIEEECSREEQQQQHV